MQPASWVSLFRQIPINLHDSVVLLTTTGAEVMVQTLLRLDIDYAIIRGRMSGTMDGGRIMIVPYDQIHTLAFGKRLLETDVHAIFGANGTTNFAPPIQLSRGKDSAAEESNEDEEAPVLGEGLLSPPTTESPLPEPTTPSSESDPKP